MIHTLCGDLLLSRADLIAHGVAPHDDFKHGLALALREKFPAMYKDFRHFCHQQNPKPGTAWLWAGVDHRGDPVRIAALFTQDPPDHPGGRPGKAQTEHVNQALHTLRKLIVDERLTSVALPRLATGVGGLDWQHVEPLVRAQLGSLTVPICIYTEYKPGLGALEPLTVSGGA